jgi:hypothetical protein
MYQHKPGVKKTTLNTMGTVPGLNAAGIVLVGGVVAKQQIPDKLFVLFVAVLAIVGFDRFRLAQVHGHLADDDQLVPTQPCSLDCLLVDFRGVAVIARYFAVHSTKTFFQQHHVRRFNFHFFAHL